MDRLRVPPLEPTDIGRGRLDRNALVLFFATGASIGRCPVAPASLASFATLVVLVVLRDSWLFRAGFALVVVAAVAIGCAVAGRAETLLGAKDDVRIVIDDIAGFLIAVYGFQQARVDVLLAAWVLFRLVDNLKLFPIGLIERRAPGGWGIMLDDVVAGVYANVILRLALAWWSATPR